LTDAPRNVTKIILSPGNRADVAVRCQNVGSKQVESFWFNGYFNAATTSPTHLMQIQIIESATASNPQPISSLSDSTMRRPCYLADLRNENLATDDTFNITFAVQAGVGLVNGEAFHDAEHYVKDVTVGTVQQVGECVFC
jgi:hypothetical protein